MSQLHLLKNCPGEGRVILGSLITGLKIDKLIVVEHRLVQSVQFTHLYNIAALDIGDAF